MGASHLYIFDYPPPQSEGSRTIFRSKGGVIIRQPKSLKYQPNAFLGVIIPPKHKNTLESQFWKHFQGDDYPPPLGGNPLTSVLLHVKPRVGRRRAAAALPLHEVVLSLVNASVAAGRYGVSSIQVITPLLHFICLDLMLYALSVMAS